MTYEQLMEWDKNELAECVLSLNQSVKELKIEIEKLKKKR